MSTPEPTLLMDTQAGVLTLRMNRPKVNALNLELVRSLQDAFRQAERDAQVRCVLLTGRGSAFSAGQDLFEIKQAEETSFRYHILRTYNPLIVQIRRLEKPVLAAINGPVSGAALGIALACDLRIAAESARFVVGFLGIGLVPDSAVSLLLPAIIGLGRATELTLTNAPLDAGQALALGLVSRVVPDDQLIDQASAWASQLARAPMRAIGLTKRAFNKAALPNLEGILDYEAHLQDIAAREDEHKEGVRAFLEKRPPQYYRPR